MSKKPLLVFVVVIAIVMAFSSMALAEFVKGIEHNMELYPDWIVDGQTQPIFTYADSIKEIVYTLTFIVMQEDINYTMPRYHGRKMSFYRYIEAIALNDPTIKTTYNIDDVILRALKEGGPPPPLFHELERDEKYIKDLPH